MIVFEYVGKDGDCNDYYTITDPEGFLIGYLENRNKKWVLDGSCVSDDLNSETLRQIADKLDELNK